MSINNYWCELLDPVTVNGIVNPSQASAVVANSLLTFSLIFFWFLLGISLKEYKIISWLVAGFGIFAMLAATFIFTSSHDILIKYAGPFGFVAFIAAALGQWKKKDFALFWLAMVALVFCGINYLMWISTFLLPALPLTQKFAFVFLFLWILCTSWKLAKN